MQRLLKFASPSSARRNRGSNSIEILDEGSNDAPTTPQVEHQQLMTPTKGAGPGSPAHSGQLQAAASPPPGRPCRRRMFFNNFHYHHSFDETSKYTPITSGAGDCSPPASRQRHHRLIQSPKQQRAAVSLTSDPELSPESFRLTVEQCELVKRAWRSCHEKGGMTAGAWIFKRIFANHPQLKCLFGLERVDDESLERSDIFRRHATVFTDVLDMIVDGVDCLEDSLGPFLLSYGAKHVQFESEHGFRPEYWDAFGAAMTEYASNNWKFLKSGQRRSEALRAWRILVQFVLSKVKEGFVLEKQNKTNDR